MELLKKAMDPISWLTHFIGAGLSLIGLFIIIVLSKLVDIPNSLFLGVIIFGISLIALYSASSLYHYFSGSEKIKLILRKLDHSMIYVLIVGTYTPVVLFCMESPKCYYFLMILWMIALIGVIVSVCWINAPRIISTFIYLLLGWAVIFDFQSFSLLPSHILSLIAYGGISYSVGAIIYIIKKPNISSYFGFHEIFHIFVMVGSLLHYIAVLLLVL
ncbi:MAG: hemolysin III family protein [Bacilli bacterium]|nr:hemolysin III family protein [Bacilli bacterium]